VKKRYSLRVDLVHFLAGLTVAAALAGCTAADGRPSGVALEPSPVAAASTPARAQPPATNTTDPKAVTDLKAATATTDPKPATAAMADPPAPAADTHGDVSLDDRPVIACFGDSLTAGLGIDASSSYPADLQRMLDEAGYHYRVVNEGVSGDTTKDGVERIDRVLAGKPQIVVVEFGGNDGLRGLPVQGAQHNLAAMIAQLQRGGAKVALAGITMPPQYGPQYITQFNAMYPALAKKYRVPLLPFILQDVWGVEGDIQPDGVHPTAQGARQVAANVEKLIEPMLKHKR
jgi:acyl-CoA thioesterase-1